MPRPPSLCVSLLCLSLGLGPVQPTAAGSGGAGPFQGPEQGPGEGHAPAPSAPVFDPTQSLLVRTLQRGEQPPEARALRSIHLTFEGARGAPPGLRRTREQALELAQDLRRQLEAGADFVELSRLHSAAPNAASGGEFGTLSRGHLAGPFDDFLFQSEVGAISEPLLAPNGYHLLQRVDRFAAARTIQVLGHDAAARERLRRIEARLAAGEPFATVARELSEDPLTAGRDGALAIYERGPADRLLKAAAFAAEVGETVGPIESPLGLHLVQRVPEAELDESLREQNWIRASALVLLQRETALPIPSGERSSQATDSLAQHLHLRLTEGEDFAELARIYNEDFGDGRGRAGDLGWLHRRQPGLSPALLRLFQAEVGELLEPVPTNFGWMLLRRDR
jgi:parvulin-like peptidyl-prolyl isomerase